MKTRTISLIYILFTLSGFAGLIYESLWSRYLKLLLGHSSYGQILTLMIFMGGLGIGSFWGGRWANRLKQPLLLYAGAEAAVGLGALVYHNLFLAGQKGLFHLLGWLQWSGPLTWLLKTLTALLLTAPWAIALGITFPALAIGLIRLQQDMGRATLPWLYFSNSLGGAAGILAASYALVPAYGTPGTLILAGFINLILAAVFYLLARTLHEEAPQPLATAPVQALSHQQILWLLLGVALLTGFSSFLYEITWIRLLSLIIGSSTHSFDVMVAAFISGLAFGGLFARQLHERFQQPLPVLAIVHILMGICAALSLQLYQALFEIINLSHLVFQTTPEAYPFYSMFKYGLCLLLMFPASFLAGTTLPLITWTLVRSQGEHKHVGSVYGWNTLGAILGASLGGLVMMPVFQLKWTLLTGALVDLGLGVVLLAVIRPGTLKLGLATASALLLMLPSFLLNLNGFTLSSGLYRQFDGNTAVPEGDQVKIKDGRTATISFHNHAGRLIIKTNGKPDASLDTHPVPGSFSDEVTQMALAMFPINIMHKNYQAAMIGLGSGMTAHTLLGDPLLKQLDLIEIEPVMAELARGFEPYNRRVYESPKVKMVFDDAKSYFFAQQKRYDLIISEPSNPWVSGVASLFTTEFYDYIGQFLSDDGVLVQWMHTYEFKDGLFLSILKALQEHFPEVAIYGIPANTPGNMFLNDVIILASRHPIQFAGAGRNLGELNGELARIQRLPDDYQSNYLLVKGKTLLPLLETIHANSDFYPLVDNRAELSFYLKDKVNLADFLYNSPLYYQSLSEPDFDKILQNRLRARAGNGERDLLLAQLNQLLTAPAPLLEKDKATETFYNLVQNFYALLSFKEPALLKYQTLLSKQGYRAEWLQYKVLEAIKQQDLTAMKQWIDQILIELPPPLVKLPVVRTMAIACLQHQDLTHFDRVLKGLALQNNDISEAEKLYLQGLSASQPAPQH